MTLGNRSLSVDRDLGDESLVPVIEQEERRLAEMLESARVESDDRVRAAEREAERRIGEVRKQIPAMKEERRKEAMAQFKQEAQRLRLSCSLATEELKAASRTGMKSAVVRIVDAVWPTSWQESASSPDIESSSKRVSRG